MNISLFAHAGENHESNAESFIHLISEDPTLYVPAIIIVSVLLLFAMWLIYKKSLSAGIISTLILLLVSGMTMYTIAPILSTVAIVTGFSLSLFLVYNGLRQDNY